MSFPSESKDIKSKILLKKRKRLLIQKSLLHIQSSLATYSGMYYFFYTQVRINFGGYNF
jgi:hypothetical protein